MTEEKTRNSLADFLHRHRDNSNLLEGVVDAVETKLIGDESMDDLPCVVAFRVNPTLKNPYGKRRYFFVLPTGYVYKIEDGRVEQVRDE